MIVDSFLKLVEIQTKVASMIPFLLGTCYAFVRFGQFDVKNFLLMFISLLTVDMATTAINNYYDYKKALKTHGYGYEVHNAIVYFKMREGTVISIILGLIGIAVVAGILLFLQTGLVVLALGAVSFAVGILYSFGPLPISRTPFGEMFSGFFMGFIIIFISAYIHLDDRQLAYLVYDNRMVNVGVHLFEVVFIFLFSVPTMAGIANIMLANNICDIDDDIHNHRYTLPIYLGKGNALLLFKALYYISYVTIVLTVVLGLTSMLMLLVLVTLSFVQRNIRAFEQVQTKKDTFIVAVKNFVVINLAQLVVMGLLVVIRLAVE